MRRTIIAAVALVVLAAAAAAYAATPLNTYKPSSLTFSSKSAGTPAKPVPAGFVELFGANNGTAGLAAAPITDIKLKMYGLKVDTSKTDFPTCSYALISKNYGATCPAKSLVAEGPVTAVLGPTNLMPIYPPATGANAILCHTLLKVWNAGGGKVTELTTIDAAHGTCGGLQTGAAAPYPVTFKNDGNYLLQNAPLPADVSTDAGNLGLYSSITLNDLTWFKLTAKVKGKTVAFLSSVGCDKGKRPYSMTYTATNGTTPQTSTVSGTGKC